MSRLMTHAELEQACARLAQAVEIVADVAALLAMHAHALSSHRGLPAVDVLPDDPTPTRSWVGWRPREED